MARIAGSSRNYNFRLVNSAGSVTDHGFALPSVTTVLSVISKPWMRAWGFKKGLLAGQKLNELKFDLAPLPYEDVYRLAKENLLRPEDYVEERSVRGSHLHDFLEALANNQEFDAREPDAIALANWWQNQRGVEVAMVEQPVWSLEYGFAGQMDLLLTTPEGPVLVDLKSGNFIDWAVKLQLAAYAVALQETHGVFPVRGEVIHVTQGKAKSYSVTNLHACFDAFRAALVVYNAERALKKFEEPAEPATEGQAA